MYLKLFSGSPFFHKTSFPTRLSNQTCQTFFQAFVFFSTGNSVSPQNPRLPAGALTKPPKPKLA